MDFAALFTVELVVGWIIFTGLVTWWASAWGRDPGYALFGSVVLSPLIWAIVLMVLGRNPDPPEATAEAPRRAEKRPEDMTPSELAIHTRRAERGSLRFAQPAPFQTRQQAEREPLAQPVISGNMVTCTCHYLFRPKGEDVRSGTTACPRCGREISLRPGKAADETPRVVLLPAGVVRCSACARIFSPSEKENEAGVATCPRCDAQVALRETETPVTADAPDHAGPIVIRNPATPDAAADCPGCGHAVAVAFEDAKAGQATCPQCWRTFDIAVR